MVCGAHLLGMVLASADKMADLVTHCLCCNTGGRSFEIDMTAASNASVEGVGAWCEGCHGSRMRSELKYDG
jgi:hypothetical protein